jgi:hypothetical protein
MHYAFAQANHRRLVSLSRPDNGLRHDQDLMFRGSIRGMYLIDRRRREAVA